MTISRNENRCEFPESKYSQVRILYMLFFKRIALGIMYTIVQ